MSAVASAQITAPEGWRFVATRPEATPKPSVVQDGSTFGLAIAGCGSGICDGKWVKTVDVPAGHFLNFTCRYRARDIEMASRNLLAGVAWLDAKGMEIAQADLAATGGKEDTDGWRSISAVFPIPPKAKQVRMDLRLRWSAAGQVEFRNAQVRPAEAPKARMVKIASVNHRPRGTKTASDNLEQFGKLIDDAGAHHADIVCLPEGITLVGRSSNYLACGEPLPGPTTEYLGQCALHNHLYIVAGLYERDGESLYNTAVLIGRDGKIAGKYRKICLPGSESDGGLAPGRDYPVFDTDFGRIGIMICWDVSYPEVARELAYRGAELILMPIWGGNETLCKARAIENQIPLVISSYDLRSAIYDQAGEAKAIAKDTSSCVVYADLNLAEVMDWKWIGHWRNQIWAEGPVRKDGGDGVVVQAGK